MREQIHSEEVISREREADSSISDSAELCCPAIKVVNSKCKTKFVPLNPKKPHPYNAFAQNHQLPS